MTNVVINPENPSIGDQRTIGGTRQEWDGSKWKNVSFGNHEVRLQDLQKEKASHVNLWGERFKGSFAAGFTYTDEFDVGLGQDGNYYSYIGSDPFPITVAAGTIASDFDLIYQNTEVTSHIAVSSGLIVNSLSEMLSLTGLSDGQRVTVKNLRTYTYTDGLGFDLEYDLVVAYGQSNTKGEATPSGDNSRPDNFPDPLDDKLCQQWNLQTQEFEPITYNTLLATSSTGDVSRGHAWSAFANEYVKRTGRGVLLVNGGFGGQSIADLSKPGTIYTRLVDAIAEVDAHIASEGYTIANRFVLWHQGESDMSEGTTRNEYQVALDDMRTNLAADINCDKMFIALVGCPQNRDESSWAAIQSAQEYVCAAINSVYLAYTDFGSFTASNGLLRDGVHATQRGYNLMGAGMAESVSQSLSLETTASDTEQGRYGVINAPEDQVWRQFSATATFDGTQWVLQDKDNSGIRLACIGGVESVPSSDTDRLRFYFTTRVTGILSVNASFNTDAALDGVTHLSSIIRDDVPDLYQGAGYALELRIFQDIPFVVNSLGELRTYPEVSETIPNFLSGVTSTLEADNSVTLTHPRTSQVPSLSVMGTSTSVGANFVSLKNDGQSKLTTKYKVGDSADANFATAVTLHNCMINPLHAEAGWSVNISGIIAELRY